MESRNTRSSGAASPGRMASSARRPAGVTAATALLAGLRPEDGEPSRGHRRPVEPPQALRQSLRVAAWPETALCVSAGPLRGNPVAVPARRRAAGRGGQSRPGAGGGAGGRRGPDGRGLRPGSRQLLQQLWPGRCSLAAVSGPADTADTGGYRKLPRKRVPPAFSGSGFEFLAFRFDTEDKIPGFFGKTSPEFCRRTGNFPGPTEVCAANFD